MVRDTVSEVFGYVLMAAALLMFLRERAEFAKRGIDAWLVTRARFRRRTAVSLTMAATGGLIAAWGRGLVDFRDRGTGRPDALLFTLFVLALTGLGLLLLVLALVDALETARNAARQSLQEFPLPDSVRQTLAAEAGVELSEASEAAGSNPRSDRHGDREPIPPAGPEQA